ncbi:clustered mitochondria-domain-containing protein [Lipomyces japonicus]|uniref:clustered mitochondria-domain-containing protein n=1 Tax=Lipomyces japonicus TaxID=56871 RepID=UPI0034CED07B
MSEAKEHVVVEDTAQVSNGELDHQSVSGQLVDEIPEMLSLNVKLPHEPRSIKIVVSIHETFNDIRQSILDLPATVQYTCFSLWFNGSKLNDFLELHTVEGIHDGAVLELREEPYNDREARLHVSKLRDVIGLVSTRSSVVTGLSAGLSALSQVDKLAQSFKDKSNPSKHAVADLDLAAPPNLEDLLPTPPSSQDQPVKSLGISSWNPPPATLRLRGHLIYLQVLTLEGAVHHITGDISGFYISNSSNQKFDPSPKQSKGGFRAHSLLTLLGQISPLFKERLLEWQTALGQRDALTIYNPTNSFLASPWLARPGTAPVADVSRSQEQYLLGGTDNLDTVRDWNDDIQSTREMPRSTIQERILRERLLNKLYFDFAEAAAKGAVLIARDEVPAINAQDPRDSQIYLYNGIFFSYGADGVGTFEKEGGDEAAWYAVGKDLAGVKFVNQLDIDGICPLCTVIVDYCGRRIVAQSPVPGILRQKEDGTNQIVYGGADNKDVVANNESFVPYFKKVAERLHLKEHPVWDKDGKEFDLVTSVELKGLEGTDGRKYILDLYRATPLDVEFLSEVGNDQENSYPHKMATLRPEAIDEWWKDKVRIWIQENREKFKQEGKEIKVYYKSVDSDEPTLIHEPKSEASAEENAENSTVEEESKQFESLEISGFKFGLNPDVYSGQAPTTEEGKKTYFEDESNVRDVAKFITSKLIPNLLADLWSGDLSIPVDSTQLSKTLHKRGISLRYLGKIIDQIDANDKYYSNRLASFRHVLVQDVVIRSTKYVANAIFKNLPIEVVPSAAAHIFNSILGIKLNADPKPHIEPSLAFLYSSDLGNDDFGFAKLTASDIQSRVTQEALRRFRYALPEDWATTKISPVSVFRELSIRLGFQWKLKQYHFATESATDSSKFPVKAEVTNGEAVENTGVHKQAEGKKGKKSHQNGYLEKKKTNNKVSTVATTTENVLASATAVQTTFTPDDLLNIVPFVKDSDLRSQLAGEAMETGRLSLIQGQKEVGVELLVESLSLHEQIYGILHPEVARAYSQLSLIYSSLEEKAAAVDLARKAVVIAERTIGIDSSETLLMYLNLALSEHANGNSNTALSLIRHALQLWNIITDYKNPDTVTTLNNAAVMLQSLQEFHDSKKWFEDSLALTEEIFGPASVNAATLYFQLAQALVLVQEPQEAVKKMRSAYNIFKAELGPDDRNTKESESWLESLTQSAVQHARQAKDLATRKARKLNIISNASKLSGTKPVQGFADPISSTSSKKGKSNEILPDSLNTKSIDELVKYISG